MMSICTLRDGLSASAVYLRSAAKIPTGAPAKVGDTGRNRSADDADREQQLIAAALSIWPAIARHHLRVGVGMSLCDTHGMACERAGVVVYDTSEDEEK